MKSSAKKNVVKYPFWYTLTKAFVDLFWLVIVLGLLVKVTQVFT